MFELTQAGNCTYYLQSPSKIGIYVRENGDAWLIDSGSAKEAGKKALKILTAQGWTLQGILSTHSHADHTGGNAYLQEQTGCRIFANTLEGVYTENPILEPSFLFGADPVKELRTKFFLAAPSRVVPFSDAAFPSEVQVIPLPGHFFDMVGYLCPDGTAFIADSVSSPETIEKYAVTFLYDVGAQFETLDMLDSFSAGRFVPSHAPMCTDIRMLTACNRDKMNEIIDNITGICEKPTCFESVLKQLADRYALTLDMGQYVLVGNTVKAYLSYLKETGKTEAIFENNMLLWKSTEVKP